MPVSKNSSKGTSSSSVNKLDLVRATCAKFNAENPSKTLSVAHAAELLDMFFEVAVEMVGKYGSGPQKVNMGRLTIKAVDVAASTGRNPRTGDKITLPARRKLSASVGQTLKTMVNSATGTKKKK